ncbi:MAG: 6-carboxytetrahydropterin synthase [Planctomycetes bacterium]|nr:6-carboxytetrahydropterin synthase [Planctomycetota bacterium]
MQYLTSRFRFSSSHRLHSVALDAEENEQTYGLCGNIHGHNYLLEVTVSGTSDPKTGFFCNVMDLKELVNELIVDVCEHQYLNDLDLFKSVVPTMENIAQVVWDHVLTPLNEQGMTLFEVKLGETEDHWVQIRGE